MASKPENGVKTPLFYRCFTSVLPLFGSFPLFASFPLFPIFSDFVRISRFCQILSKMSFLGTLSKVSKWVKMGSKPHCFTLKKRSFLHLLGQVTLGTCNVLRWTSKCRFLTNFVHNSPLFCTRHPFSDPVTRSPSTPPGGLK